MAWRSETVLTLLAAVLALVWTAVLARPHVQGLASPLDRFEEVCLDLRALLAPARPPPPDVVVVAIDDETIQKAGAYPLPRPVLSALVEAIARHKPRTIALDLLFLDPGPAEADAALSRALALSPTVIAAAGQFQHDGRETPAPDGALAAVPAPTRVLWPVEPMASASEVGLVNVSTGFAGTPRHVPMLFRQDSRVVPSLALLAAALATGASPHFAADAVRFGDRRVALDMGDHLALRYYGPRGTIPTVSAAAVEAPGAPDLAGRVVLIGSTATGVGDTFATPFSAVVPGVEILATAVANLLGGDALVRTRLTRWVDAGAAALLALAAVGLIALRRSIVSLGLVLLLAGLWSAATLIAFAFGLWLSTALPIAAMLPVAALYGAMRLWQDRRDALRLAGVARGLRPFQPRPMSDLLAKDPAFLTAPVVQDAAVLFVDLSGYTTLSENADPVRMRDLIKSFHALVDATIDRHGGFVGTFMGDGAMILFGFPQPRPDDAARALGALQDLESRLRAWGSAPATGLGPPIRARLAAHYGPVVVSRLGGDTHQQITATGDTVNVTSRLLEVAKLNKVSTVISESIFAAAGPRAPTDRFPARIEMPIRGRSQPVAVRLGVA